MLIVAVTGNYGMGKSTVLPLFRQLGAYTIDADEIVQSLLKEEAVIREIRRIFGREVFRTDGSLDKKKLAETVFEDADRRICLEDMLHPLVFERMRSVINRRKEDIIIAEIPLLFERGYKDRVDKTITVYTDPGKALERLAGKGIGRREAMQRLKTQLPVTEKIARSDFAINNNGDIEETQAQVESIYQRLLKEVSG